MSKILEALGTKDEEEAIAKLKILAAPPIAITIVATADGGLQIATSGPISPTNAQALLIEAARMVVEMTKKKQYVTGVTSIRKESIAIRSLLSSPFPVKST